MRCLTIGALKKREKPNLVKEVVKKARAKEDGEEDSGRGDPGFCGRKPTRRVRMPNPSKPAASSLDTLFTEKGELSTLILASAPQGGWPTSACSRSRMSPKKTGRSPHGTQIHFRTPGVLPPTGRAHQTGDLGGTPSALPRPAQILDFAVLPRKACLPETRLGRRRRQRKGTSQETGSGEA